MLTLLSATFVSAAIYNMKYLGVDVETEERSRSKKSKLKRKERDEAAYTSARWVPYVKVWGRRRRSAYAGLCCSVLADRMSNVFFIPPLSFQDLMEDIAESTLSLKDFPTVR